MSKENEKKVEIEEKGTKEEPKKDINTIIFEGILKYI